MGLGCHGLPAYMYFHAILRYVERWEQVVKVGRRQHNAVTRAQALALGIPPTTFDRRMSRERWEAPHSGVRLLPGADGNDRLTQVSAALLAVGDHALASGWTGLHLWGVILRPLSIVTLVVPWECSRRRLRAVRTIRSRTLIEEDYRILAGLAVASV